MANRRKPIERYPHDVVLPRGFYAIQNGGFTYRVRDGDTWESVAERFLVDVKELIFFNFLTTEPDEVNWYLHHHTGCNKVSPSGNNWMFSSSAKPGIIFIPPAEHDPIDVEPDEICVWTLGSLKEFTKRLITITKGMSGNKGNRIKKLVQVIVRVGYPGAKNLWYYNPGAIHIYVWIAGDAQRREMTKATNGAYPFDGYAGPSGDWQMHPAADLVDEFACRFDPATVKARLDWIDEEMYKGWHDLDLVNAQSQAGGGPAFGDMVWDFINHVHLLSKDDSHLYSAFAP